MIGYVFILLMVFFNACMDAWENTPNFNESIFKNWDKRFWCKDVSWQYARKLFKYKIDGWHIAKSLFVIFFALAVASSVLWPYRGSWYVIVANIGVIWNLGFWLIYHKLFRIK